MRIRAGISRAAPDLVDGHRLEEIAIGEPARIGHFVQRVEIGRFARFSEKLADIAGNIEQLGRRHDEGSGHEVIDGGDLALLRFRYGIAIHRIPHNRRGWRLESRRGQHQNKGEYDYHELPSLNQK